MLWAYQTTEKTSTSEMLFILAYRAESMEPIKLTCLSVRAKMVNWEHNDDKMARKLDLLDERREVASRRLKLTGGGSQGNTITR